MKFSEKQRDWFHVMKLWVRVNTFFPPSAMVFTLMDPHVQQCFRDALKEYDAALAAYNEKYPKKWY